KLPDYYCRFSTQQEAICIIKPDQRKFQVMCLHRLKFLLLRNNKLRTGKRNLKNNIHKFQRILPLIRIDEPQRYNRFRTTGRKTVKKQRPLFIIIAASLSVTGVPYKIVKDFPAFTMLQPPALPHQIILQKFPPLATAVNRSHNRSLTLFIINEPINYTNRLIIFTIFEPNNNPNRLLMYIWQLN